VYISALCPRHPNVWLKQNLSLSLRMGREWEAFVLKDKGQIHLVVVGYFYKITGNNWVFLGTQHLGRIPNHLYQCKAN
jgi:hypothetical protein